MATVNEEEKLPIEAPRWKQPAGNWTLTLEPQQCARLRELPDWSERDEDFVAESFLSGKADKWARALTGTTPGAELRVIIDQFSRQAFVIDGATVVHIDSF